MRSVEVSYQYSNDENQKLWTEQLGNARWAGRLCCPGPSERASQGSDPTGTLILGFQTAEPWEVSFCCLSLYLGILFWLPSRLMRRV